MIVDQMGTRNRSGMVAVLGSSCGTLPHKDEGYNYSPI
jgi:hypothetical protein